MNFEHVLPRDLFNYSKLFKSLGQLWIHIDNGQLPGLEFELVDETQSFTVYFNHEYDGLYVGNLPLIHGDQHLFIYSRYNSQEPYPLECVTDSHESINVLTNTGAIADEFLLYLLDLDPYPTEE